MNREPLKLFLAPVSWISLFSVPPVPGVQEPVKKKCSWNQDWTVNGRESQNPILVFNNLVGFFGFVLFFGCAHGRQKFQSWGLNTPQQWPKPQKWQPQILNHEATRELQSFRISSQNFGPAKCHKRSHQLLSTYPTRGTFYDKWG